MRHRFPAGPKWRSSTVTNSASTKGEGLAAAGFSSTVTSPKMAVNWAGRSLARGPALSIGLSSRPQATSPREYSDPFGHGQQEQPKHAAWTADHSRGRNRCDEGIEPDIPSVTNPFRLSEALFL